MRIADARVTAIQSCTPWKGAYAGNGLLMSVWNNLSGTVDFAATER